MRKRSIALVIRQPEEMAGTAGTRTDPPGRDAPGDDGRPEDAREKPQRRWLLVRRPEDDEDLPGVWGLPAGTRGPGETDRELVRRIGREKLALSVEPGTSVAAGSAARSTYRLDMVLWTAEIVAGEPDPEGAGVPAGTTRYAAWRWADPTELASGARQGSLCCRLGIELASRA